MARRQRNLRDVRLHGPDYSAYVRIARLVLAEKRVSYTLHDVDFIALDGMPAAHLERHPFGKVPVLEHGGIRLFETLAIASYVDDVFPGPALQPRPGARRARMLQAISVVDSYLSEPLRLGVVSQQLFRRRFGRNVDDAALAAAIAPVSRALAWLNGAVSPQGYLGTGRLSLADLHAMAMVDYLMMCPVGAELLQPLPALFGWWQRLCGRASVALTRPDLDARFGTG